jgi:KipI family sensor histidine kinase inhibitor
VAGAVVKINKSGRFLALGDAALTIEFGTEISRGISARVMHAARGVTDARLRGVHDVVPSFRSLTVHYDPLVIPQEQLIAVIGELEIGAEADTAPERVWRLPVLYGGDAGPDLDEVARAAGLATAEVAALHARETYHVYMLGFLPGFAYLGDLPAPLRLPRLAEPRKRVPPGSVAIADQLTAVYPVQSPGGWRLIGRTPLTLFDHRAAPPSLFVSGDGVRFEPVDRAEFDRIARAVAKGDYRPAGARR